jgi:hypothetical protein
MESIVSQHIPTLKEFIQNSCVNQDGLRDKDRDAMEVFQEAYPNHYPARDASKVISVQTVTGGGLESPIRLQDFFVAATG